MLAALLFALQQPKLQEQITVERVIVDARVTDSNGEPITGLKPSDFIVKIDGKRAVVEAADWIADTAAQREVDEQLNGGHALSPVPSPGRLLVFLYQTDFARHDARVRGQMKLLQMDEWLDWIEPEDRVAVLSFDSHLKFRLDFTNNKHDIANAMEESLYISDPPWPQRVPLPSLGSRLKPEELAKDGSPERALIEIGNALMNIPGPKSLILFGWGLGRFSRDGVRLAPHYWIAPPGARSPATTSGGGASRRRRRAARTRSTSRSRGTTRTTCWRGRRTPIDDARASCTTPCARRNAMASKYGKKAQDKVEKAMHERKHGTLKSGKSGKKVKSRKQAIAIGLSEARREGGKVPSKKSSSKKSSSKKPRSKKSSSKKSSSKKSSSKRK